MLSQIYASSVGATRINIGLSAIIKVSAAAYEAQNVFKILSGGGTLEIVQSPTALTGVGATGWGTGYPVGAAEIISVTGPSVYYLAASGATMTIAMMFGYTNGAPGI